MGGIGELSRSVTAISQRKSTQKWRLLPFSVRIRWEKLTLLLQSRRRKPFLSGRLPRVRVPVVWDSHDRVLNVSVVQLGDSKQSCALPKWSFQVSIRHRCIFLHHSDDFWLSFVTLLTKLRCSRPVPFRFFTVVLLYLAMPLKDVFLRFRCLTGLYSVHDMLNCYGLRL